MKAKWVITYWDNNVDAARKVGTSTYEEALTLAEKLRRKGHNNVQIKLR